MATNPLPRVDTTFPNTARIYDYLLGGKDNYAADRAAAQRMVEVNPSAPRTALANRAFLRRAVRHAATEGGVRQFLDIGAGLPTRDNVHQVAMRAAPESRVVYVDRDPVVVVHGQALLATSPQVTVIQEDLRDPGDILDHPETQRLIDFERPVCLLLVAVLHFISDREDPLGILAHLCGVLAPGSYLVISHTVDESPALVMNAARRGFQNAGTPLSPRARPAVERFFDGFELVDPGLVEVDRWRPDDPVPPALSPSPWVLVGGVGHKP
ncbi:SAM-dependent methyltransferase [Spongiactinospora sp. TRM90649]|uniref:SAM-dependent methyltransferase n=1 Tax=Spongiactinospora sp. TRM90649 TaxID=3031114 RepID=UPI0023F85ECC|nr:SAM-dependent methyltransferase [Spongiactinospora sp. TRM90649]MDF5758093.1 SAM-dependent methyltransferase [Spongiactinospora sp. TRM90649]